MPDLDESDATAACRRFAELGAETVRHLVTTGGLPDGMRLGWPTKLAFAALTLVNLALVLCGAWVALWTPMLFERGSTKDPVLVATAVGFVVFPVVALICAILPWLFLRVRWRGVAFATAILPVAIAASFYALLRLAIVLQF